MTMMTWNIEGLKRNIFSLKELTLAYSPDVILLSEPQIFLCDIAKIMLCFQGEYMFHLNSQDKFDPELALLSSRTYGGTMAMWKIEFDPFISVHPPPSASILPLLFRPCGYPASVHINVYLPTHGKDDQFIAELSNLSALILDLEDNHPNSDIYIRGDFNVNIKNRSRLTMFDSIKSFHSEPL